MEQEVAVAHTIKNLHSTWLVSKQSPCPDAVGIMGKTKDNSRPLGETPLFRVKHDLL